MAYTNQSNIALKNEPGLLQSFAQAQLEKKLSKIPRGILTIEDGPGMTSFGKKSQETLINLRMVKHYICM